MRILINHEHAKDHFKKHWKLYAQVGVIAAGSILLDPTTAFASIDSGGARIHSKLVGVGKWVVIIKGTIDSIQSVLNGDITTAKKQVLGYLLCFAIMFGLPWGLNEIEGTFKQ